MTSGSSTLITLGALYERLFRLTVERPDCLRFLRAHKALHAAIEVWPRNRDQARTFALVALRALNQRRSTAATPT